MSISHTLLLVACAALLCAAHASPPAKPRKPVFYYIPHTHWEGAVFFTREEYLESGLSFILSAIHLMEKDPDYKFTLDQVAYIRPFLERYPEEVPAFRKFVAEGRLGVVGGMDVMPDDVKPGGELLVRQMLYGKGWCQKALGIDVKAAWLLDTFGHHPQMPQLLRQAGFEGLWFSRGVPNNDMPSEFNWRGLDGTTVPAFWLPGFYGLLYGPPRDLAGFTRFFEDRYTSLNPHARPDARVGLAGNDVSEPEQFAPPLVRAFNQRRDAPFTIRYAIPDDFMKLVAKRKDVPTIAGDFNPIFQGTYSSRIELHQATREIEEKLLTAEKLGAISNWLGEPTSDAELWRAWEPLLFNQAHDTASGVMTDPVYDDTVQSYQYSRRLADEMIEKRLGNLLRRIDTNGPGVPVVVFNSQGFARTDLAQVDLGFAHEGVTSLQVVGPNGAVEPSQITRVERYEDGTLRRVKLAFLARNLPALGYAVYCVVPRQGRNEAKEGLAGDNVLENEFYKLSVNLKTGEITSIVDKVAGVEVLSGPANVVVRQEDRGDLWELYHPLDGGMFIAATDKQPVPTAKTALLSNSFESQDGVVRKGPVFSEFTVSHPFGSGTFATKVRLTRGLKRIDIETKLVNNEKNVRYQVLFPTAIRGGKNVQEIPFGAVERPVGVEYPAQNWVDYGDGKRGVALLNVGMPGNVVTDGTLMLSLLRSQDLLGYNEGRPSHSGFELGVPRTFRYALVPHAGDWQAAGVVAQGLAFNSPLLVRKAQLHSGSLPARWRMLEVSSAHVTLTAVRPGPARSLVLRVYESAGKPAPDVSIRLAEGIVSAVEANLLEQGSRKCRMEGGVLHLSLRPFEIRTLRLKLSPHKA